MVQNNFIHLTVLGKQTAQAIVDSFSLLRDSHKEIKQKNVYVLDATLGGAGHSLHVIELFHSYYHDTNLHLNLIGIDTDENAIECSKIRLEEAKKTYKKFNYFVFKDNFSNFAEILNSNFPNIKLNGFCADLGVSSPQLDTSLRGFSFTKSGPIDMRMDQTSGEQTALDILLNYSEEDLARIFFDYGDEPRSRKLAKNIVMDRNLGKLPTNSTIEFAQYVSERLAYPKNSRTHPATRIFQALRIEVNQELESLRKLLEKLPYFMGNNSIAALISFHSLEDRMVKNAMRSWEKGFMFSLKKGKLSNHENMLKEILQHIQEEEKTSLGKEEPRGGIIASDDECHANVRARSARLRTFLFKTVQ